MVAAGCDGGMASGGACGDTACGGDVVGAWTISGTCLDTHPFQIPDSDCPEGQAEILGYEASGSAAFRADNSYTAETTVNVRLSIGFPPACRTTATGQLLTCDQLNQLFALYPLPGAQSVNCAGGSTDCACEYVNIPETTTETGTYATNGGTIRLSHDGETVAQEYCVDGDRLRVTDREDGQAITLAFSKEAT